MSRNDTRLTQADETSPAVLAAAERESERLLDGKGHVRATRVAATKRLATTSLIGAFVLPPAGAVLGHLTLHRRRIERDSQPKTTWRKARWAVLVGWVMTGVLIVLGGLWLGYSEQKSAQEQTAAAQELAAKQLQEAADTSPSLGKVDAAFCKDLSALESVSPETMIIRDGSQITVEILNGYRAISAGKTPNAGLYVGYISHLRDFDALSDDVKSAEALKVRTALRDDALACTRVEQ